MLCLVTLLAQPSTHLQGQSLPDIPSDINLAGTPIHVTQQGRLLIQQEMQILYAHPATIHHDISVLQQLTPILKPLLDKANLPDDFRFVVLPFAEVDSVGFWALSKLHGRRLNLRMDSYVDERFHFAISTEVVLNELVRLQETQKNYALTLLKYLQENTDSRLSQLTDPIYILLGTQNSPLIWKILARKLVFEQEVLNYRPSVNYILYTYPNGEGQTLNAIAERLQITEDQVRPLNRWLKTTYIPTNKEYSILVQVTSEEFSRVQLLATSESRNDKLRQPSSAFPVLVKVKDKSDKLRSDVVFYTINERHGVQAQNCDNIITLAFYGNITVGNFLKYNDLSVDNSAIRPGEVYYLQTKAKRGKIPFHVTQKNQTLLEISNRYGIRLKSLLKYNHMTATQKLQPGRIVWLQTKRPTSQPIEYIQLPPEEPIIARAKPLMPYQDSLQKQPDEIKILPKPSIVKDSLVIADDRLQTVDDDTLILLDVAPTAVPVTTKQHVVTPGQTYYAISRLYGVTVNQLYDWNKLSERIPLRIGQRLIVGVSTQQQVIVSKPIYKRKTIVKRQLTPLTRNAIFYTVHTGETLYRIALLNKVQVKDLVRWNDLKKYVIEVGQILLIWK
ncbi:LysM peptidoglycan-binding domain-containing protein [Spirosoma foliorum]|uniref:LysM peptidoglycan-binding domain-containing protein n=2 Tax=Spirosoma foliorum TaxID=2710596 RepID=A0A7G5H7N6_9BACT|nr:LysM peptidoglycan-binding domain-containing protein [Spirosoma foliorum]